MGELIIGILSFTFALVGFIAIMKCWENTGKMAHFAELQWKVTCRGLTSDPKGFEKSLMEMK